MTASTEVKAVMVMVSGHGRKILVVVEDGLGEPIIEKKKETELVLILVVVEDGLGEFIGNDFVQVGDGLNPCCSGRWSRSQ